MSWVVVLPGTPGTNKGRLPVDEPSLALYTDGRVRMNPFAFEALGSPQRATVLVEDNGTRLAVIACDGTLPGLTVAPAKSRGQTLAYTVGAGYGLRGQGVDVRWNQLRDAVVMEIPLGSKSVTAVVADVYRLEHPRGKPEPEQAVA